MDVNYQDDDEEIPQDELDLENNESLQQGNDGGYESPDEYGYNEDKD